MEDKAQKSEAPFPALRGRRILVLGCPGSGKSTLSVRLSEITGIPLVHLDSIWWRPDGTHISRDEFDLKLAELLVGEEWIIDGDYSRTYEPRIRACTDVILLDIEEEVCMRGITERLGIPRNDMPWTPRELDPMLVSLVSRWRTDNRPILFGLRGKYPGAAWHIIQSRSEAEDVLAALAGRADAGEMRRTEMENKGSAERTAPSFGAEDPFMAEAAAEAYFGITHGHGGPFGSVIVREGEIVGRGHNSVLAGCDSTAHGEICAIRDAEQKLGTHDLKGCVLYTTGEPCPMCLFACLWANIEKVVYGCTIADNSSIGFRDGELDRFTASREELGDYLECRDREACLALFRAYAETEHETY